MSSNNSKRENVMGVRYSKDDVRRLKTKAKDVGLDVSTYVRYVSLNSLKDE
jgi:predicted DNA binding CopG/RHH family protein